MAGGRCLAGNYKREGKSMIIEKNREGAYVISDIVSGYLVTRSYYGHTKRDAVRLFRQYVRES